jgi:hypothetical protein
VNDPRQGTTAATFCGVQRGVTLLDGRHPPLIIFVREEKCNKNRVKVIEISITNLSEKVEAGKGLIRR